MDVRRAIYYRTQHVIGPGAVLVSIKFGATPKDGPRIVKLLAKDDTKPEITFDLANHVSEILAGVAKANAELGGSLQVEEIQVVPDDYPKKTQAERAAYEIARAAIRERV